MNPENLANLVKKVRMVVMVSKEKRVLKVPKVIKALTDRKVRLDFQELMVNLETTVNFHFIVKVGYGRVIKFHKPKSCRL